MALNKAALLSSTLKDLCVAFLKTLFNRVLIFLDLGPLQLRDNCDIIEHHSQDFLFSPVFQHGTRIKLMYASISPHLHYMLREVKMQGSLILLLLLHAYHPKFSLICFNRFRVPLWEHLLKIPIRFTFVVLSDSLELAFHYIVFPSTDGRHLSL